MSRHDLKLPFLLIAVAGLLLISHQGVAQEKPAPLALDNSALILNLISDRFALRKDAAKELTRRGNKAVPDLLLTLQTTKNAELRKALQELVEQLLWPSDEETAKKVLAKVPELAKKGEVDVMIEALVMGREYTDRDSAKPFRELADRYLEMNKGKTENLLTIIGPMHGEYYKKVSGKIVGLKELEGVSGVHLLAEAVEYVPPFSRGLAVVTEWRGERQSFSSSYVFLNSPTIARPIYKSLLICNGDLAVRYDANSYAPIHDSLVICNGNVHFGAIYNSAIIATGDIISPNVKHRPGSHLQPNDKEIGKLWFTNNTSLGAVFAMIDKRLVISSLESDGLLAQSKLQKNDGLVALNGRAIRDKAEFFQLVCRTRALGATAYLTVLRESEIQILTFSSTEHNSKK